MSDQLPLLDWTEATARRDDGMARAVEHADAVAPSWSERALRSLMEFKLYNPAADSFMAEEVRKWSELNGLAAPPDGRAWGAVFQRAARAGHIVRLGYAPAKSSNLS